MWRETVAKTVFLFIQNPRAVDDSGWLMGVR